MVQMLFLRSLDAVVIRENEFDPLRHAVSRLNKLYYPKDEEGNVLYTEAVHPFKGLELLAAKFSDDLLITGTCEEAEAYIGSLGLEGPSQDKFRQAALAYFFSKGRSIVARESPKANRERKEGRDS